MLKAAISLLALASVTVAAPAFAEAATKLQNLPIAISDGKAKPKRFAAATTVSEYNVWIVRTNRMKQMRVLYKYDGDTTPPNAILDAGITYIRTPIHSELRNGDVYEEGTVTFTGPFPPD